MTGVHFKVYRSYSRKAFRDVRGGGEKRHIEDRQGKGAREEIEGITRGEKEGGSERG